MSDAPSGREGSPFAKSKSSFTFRAEIPKKRAGLTGRYVTGKRTDEITFMLCVTYGFIFALRFWGIFGVYSCQQTKVTKEERKKKPKRETGRKRERRAKRVG